MIAGASAGQVLDAPHGDVRRIVLGCVAVLLALGAIELSATLQAVLAPLCVWTAWATASVLAGVGVPVMREGTFLLDAGGFAAEIDYLCTALVPSALLAAAVLAHPSSLQARLRCLALGVVLLAVLNTLRLAHLFWLGVHAPEYFWVVHVAFWPPILVVLTIGYWAAWLCAPTRRR